MYLYSTKESFCAIEILVCHRNDTNWYFVLNRYKRNGNFLLQFLFFSNWLDCGRQLQLTDILYFFEDDLVKLTSYVFNFFADLMCGRPCVFERLTLITCWYKWHLTYWIVILMFDCGIDGMDKKLCVLVGVDWLMTGRHFSKWGSV